MDKYFSKLQIRARTIQFESTEKQFTLALNYKFLILSINSLSHHSIEFVSLVY